jgi:biofilm protein TabA
MIIDKTAQLERYAPLDERLQMVAQALKTLPKDIPDGRYPLSDDVTMLIQVRTTAKLESGLFETHERFIDVQVILEGEEVLSFAELNDLAVSQPYDTDKDIAFYSGQGDLAVIRAGMFYLMYPGEAHKCCCHHAEGLPLKKAVFKIRA